jgi:DNA-binding LacI/PurR family transcriptional regulator
MIDHFKGGRLAAQAFISRGRKRLGTVSEDMPQFIERIRGCESEIERRDISPPRRLHLESGSYEDAYCFASDQLETLKHCDGLFVQSDNSAFGIMNALQDHGVKIPDDISIIGYDDVDWCSCSRPALSTIHQPKTQVASETAEVIKDRVLNGNKDRFQKILEPDFIERESC